VTLPMNPRYPLEMPQSIDELMGIALGMEREAALRYQQLSKRMEGQGEIELAETFLDLAVLEQSHGQGLVDWARREGRPTPRAKQFDWQLPETFAETDLAGAPLSGYQALAIAVRNEELAFSFYSYLSAMTDMQPALRHYAEALADEELNHIAQLRRLRRRAFHKGSSAGQQAFLKVSDLPAFSRFAWGLENGSAVLCRLLLERLRGTDEEMVVALLDRTVAETEQRATMLAERVGGGPVPPGSRVIEAAHSGHLLTSSTLTVEHLLAMCEKDARDVLDAYLGIAEQASEAALLSASQDIAERALARLAIIRSLQGVGVFGD